ncbi:MAG: hypothetical protein EOM20_18945 [Spartobacteria bacterium]|nr:hypothetical protein [Spartobacteria bacterium]
MEMYYNALIADITENMAFYLLWTMGFMSLLALITVWLSIRITRSSSSRAVEMAKENRKQMDALKAKIDGLDVYLRDTFKKDLGGAMESFDSTVSTVLTEMKDELMHGVTRIEKIEQAVKGREKLGDRIFTETAQVKHLLDAVRDDGQPAPETQDKAAASADAPSGDAASRGSTDGQARA